jgi:hypothetical protein
MTDNNEEQRYIEYFQKCLLTEGSENFVRAEAARLELEREKIEGEKFVPKKSYLDCHFSENTFIPLIEKTLNLCKKAGIAPALPVRFANAPSLEPTAAVLPSTSSHTVFAGHGTMAFCNYWAKLFSEVLAASADFTLSNRCWNPVAFKEKIKATPLIPLATSLAIWYALNDTMRGYGKLVRDEKFTTLRVLLLNAMEVFVIGHEISHLSFQELYPETLGVPEGKTVKDLEMDCDSIGLAVCTVYGIEEENTFATNFIGPLAILYAIQLCESVKEMVTGVEHGHSETHPAAVDRIENVFSFVRQARLHPDILKIMNESLEALKIVGNEVEAIIRAVEDMPESET